MKWFKHYSVARNDERIARLEDLTGLEGYGFYFKMLEIVAEMIDASDKCEVIFSLSRWGRQTNIASKKWLFLSQRCADVGLMIVCRLPDDGVSSDYRISVKIPNLLKYRDNHTKNLQASFKQEEEEDKEKDTDKEKTKALVASDAGRPDCPHEKIIELYHLHLPEMPMVKVWTEKRKKNLAARWREDQRRQEVDFWDRFFRYVAKSDFLCGRTERPFSCNLEWLTNSSNFVKVLEGQYENRK